MTNQRLLASFLMYNDRYHNSNAENPLPENDEDWKPYDDLAKVFERKLKDMDAKLYDYNTERHTLKIELGSPKIHGRRVMRLPNISLFLSCRRESRVRFVFSQDTEEYSRLRHFFKFVAGMSLDLTRDISCHPHVSGDGFPCLGDFSQPWATTLASNDLPMLVNVARSFLNNWTRRDAYFNINDIQRTWQDCIKDLGISFKDFFIHYQVINRVEQYAQDRNNRSRYMGMSQVRWLANRHLIQQGEQLGMDFIDVWKGVTLQNWNTNLVQDVEDGNWTTVLGNVRRWKSAINTVISESHSLISEYGMHTRSLFNLTEDVMFGTDYVKRLTLNSSSSSNAQDCVWFMFWDGLEYCIKDIHHDRDRQYEYDVEELGVYLDCVVENDGEANLPTATLYLTPAQMNYSAGAYWCREWFTDTNIARSRSFMHFMRLCIVNRPDWFEGRCDIKDLDAFISNVSEVRYGESHRSWEMSEKYEEIGNMLLTFLRCNFGWTDDESIANIPINITSLTRDVVVPQSLDMIEQEYTNTLRRITDGKIKYARAYGLDTGSDDGQDSISA